VKKNLSIGNVILIQFANVLGAVILNLKTTGPLLKKLRNGIKKELIMA
jgi:hypothetical protein